MTAFRKIRWCCILLGLALLGLLASQMILRSPPSPEEWFRIVVYDPMPASVSNLEVFPKMGTIDGTCTLKFRIGKEDLEHILGNRPFKEISVRDMPSELRASVRFSEPVVYLFRGETSLSYLVTNRAHTKVYFYFVDY